MPTAAHDRDRLAAEALVSLIGSSKWMAVALARGYLALLNGQSEDAAARIVFERSSVTLRQSRETLLRMSREGFLASLPPRERTGSAENPITKLFPATVTEERFLELLDNLNATRSSVTYTDDREAGHGLTDFTLTESDLQLPVNIKNAGTRFARAKQLVGLDPDDCVPIPAYKANAAVEVQPSLLDVVCPDYDLVGKLGALLPTLMTPEEALVWQVLNKYAGSHLRAGEDAFVFATVRKYWSAIREVATAKPFFVISARRALRVLHTKPDLYTGYRPSRVGHGGIGRGERTRQCARRDDALGHRARPGLEQRDLGYHRSRQPEARRRSV